MHLIALFTSEEFRWSIFASGRIGEGCQSFDDYAAANLVDARIDLGTYIIRDPEFYETFLEILRRHNITVEVVRSLQQNVIVKWI